MIAVGERDGRPWAAVEHCLFHPQGGGQPADRGWLEDTEITPVRYRESGLVVATAPQGGSHAPLVEGQRVRARIDLGDLAEVVLPTLKVKKGRIRVSYTATHRSR
ncbi:hypothetical protein [Streptomyces sp. NPDC058371]|uniref:hypothetical protein n=1 Tax=Streptomyces sp. NPDC058371 TaxID=3346463 RepID=UPI003666D2D1